LLTDASSVVHAVAVENLNVVLYSLTCWCFFAQSQDPAVQDAAVQVLVGCKAAVADAEAHKAAEAHLLEQ
jgi:hypothetical protein